MRKVLHAITSLVFGFPLLAQSQHPDDHDIIASENVKIERFVSIDLDTKNHEVYWNRDEVKNAVIIPEQNRKPISINLVRGGGENGKDLYKIHLIAKVVDNTSSGLGARKLKRISKQISKQIKRSFCGWDRNMEFKTTIDISVTDGNLLDAHDHVFRIVDDIATSLGLVDPPDRNIEGYGPVGQNVVYLELGANYSRTAAHEFGHNVALGHPKNEVDPSTGFIYTTNDFPNNLMHQPQDLNSYGRTVDGTKIEPWQVKKMHLLYGLGALNHGKQK